MKFFRRSIIIFILSAVILFVMSCGCKSKSDGIEQQVHKNHLEEEHSSRNINDDVSSGEEIHSDEIIFKPEVAAEVGIVVQPLSMKALNKVKSFPGTIVPRPDGEAHIGSLVGGRIVKIPVGLGQKVSKTTVLCEIESPEVGAAQADYIRASVQFELAQTDLIRQQKLSSEDIGSEKVLMEKQAAAQSAGAELAASERTLVSIGFTKQEIEQLTQDHLTSGILKLKSPINGTITNWSIHLGQRVNPDEDLFHIVDLTHLWVRISFYEKDLPGMAALQSATIIPQSFPDHVFQGQIVQIGKEVHQDTRTVNGYIEVENKNDLLIPNLFVTGEIHMETDSRQVLAVPNDAVIIDENGHQSVYIEHEPFCYTLKEITTGRTNDGWIEVIDGLEEGDRVVFKGGFFIKSEAVKGTFGHGHAH